MFSEPSLPIPAGGLIPLAEIWKVANTLERFTSWGYFKVQWTDRLHEHLILHDDPNDDIPTILVFHHASFLTYSTAAAEVFPEDLLDETRCTLGLLLKRSPRVKKWFSKEAAKGKLLVIILLAFSLTRRSRQRLWHETGYYGYRPIIQRLGA